MEILIDVLVAVGEIGFAVGSWLYPGDVNSAVKMTVGCFAVLASTPGSVQKSAGRRVRFFASPPFLVVKRESIKNSRFSHKVGLGLRRNKWFA